MKLATLRSSSTTRIRTALDYRSARRGQRRQRRARRRANHRGTETQSWLGSLWLGVAACRSKKTKLPGVSGRHRAGWDSCGWAWPLVAARRPNCQVSPGDTELVGILWLGLAAG